ncbi:MAG: hypothetical protein GZ094_15895 [Mariniphaga sp.]|nr:hypothetical protein [Mariniphaga sp.]
MKKYHLSFYFILVYLFVSLQAFSQKSNVENQENNAFTPSKSIYFDWINRNSYGSNEKKNEANLKFFKRLYDEYGMQLDIYLMDAGDIDQGPNCAQSFGLLPLYVRRKTLENLGTSS